mgnify:CR=1 FL=1
MAIKVKSLAFGKPPFRKLGNFKIDFSDRLTLIAGHNGIGKSTILGLVANTFGFTEQGGPQSYFGEPFYANIERIVYLALAEVAEAQKDTASAPVVTASVNGKEVKKRCAMTQRTDPLPAAFAILPDGAAQIAKRAPPGQCVQEIGRFAHC